MRLIIFRGKRTDNGHWVTGLLTKRLVYRNKSDNGVLVDAIITALYYNEDGDGMQEWHEVDKNTIERYTGRDDIFGSSIFEGDIVEFVCKLDSRKYRGEVAYDTELALFKVSGEGFSFYLTDDEDKITRLSVEGNIH